MWRNFRFLLICHVQKFEISPHDRFSLHGHRPCVRDKYEVCPLPPTKKKQRDDKDILASTIKLSKSHGVNLRGLKGFLISTKFRGSSSHFHVDHVIIVDFYLALTSHVFYPINLKLVFWGLHEVPSKAQSQTQFCYAVVSHSPLQPNPRLLYTWRLSLTRSVNRQSFDTIVALMLASAKSAGNKLSNSKHSNMQKLKKHSWSRINASKFKYHFQGSVCALEQSFEWWQHQ